MLFAQELYAICDVVTKFVLQNVKYTLFLKTYTSCYIV